MSDNEAERRPFVRGKPKKSLSYHKLPDGKISVRNLDFAAYCAIRNLPIAGSTSTKGSRNNPRQYLYLFSDPEDEIEQLALDYLNSEAAKHADAIRRLKNMTSIVPDQAFEYSNKGGKSYIIKKD
jgi:hypothetical protein